MKDKPAVHINRLQHIGIPVVDITVSETFYKRLGFSNIMQSEFALEGKKGICIMMENSGVIIELYQLPEDKMEEIKSRKDGHIDHIAFDVDDIETAFTSLKEAGFRIMEEAPVFLSFWNKGCCYFNIIGPGGERLEFNQILK